MSAFLIFIELTDLKFSERKKKTNKSEKNVDNSTKNLNLNFYS